MPTTYKVLGQATPAATTSTDLYTVPASTSAIVSTIVVCNANTTSTSFRLSVAIAGAVLTNAQYLAFDQVIGGLGTTTFTLGITLAATDKIRCYAGATLVMFNVFGAELS
jgi:hypothetical protein